MVWEKDAPNAGFSTGTPWLPVKAPQAANAVDQQGEGSILAFYKDMIARRKSSAALSRGNTTFLALPEPILGFTRTAQEQTLTCLFNLSPDSQTLRLTGDATISFGNEFSLDDATLTLSGNGFAYLSHGKGFTVTAL
jgi:alpha-glucosidase